MGRLIRSMELLVIFRHELCAMSFVFHHTSASAHSYVLSTLTIIKMGSINFQTVWRHSRSRSLLSFSPLSRSLFLRGTCTNTHIPYRRDQRCIYTCIHTYIYNACLRACPPFNSLYRSGRFPIQDLWSLWRFGGVFWFYGFVGCIADWTTPWEILRLIALRFFFFFDQDLVLVGLRRFITPKSQFKKREISHLTIQNRNASALALRFVFFF